MASVTQEMAWCSEPDGVRVHVDVTFNNANGNVSAIAVTNNSAYDACAHVFNNGVEVPGSPFRAAPKSGAVSYPVSGFALVQNPDGTWDFPPQYGYQINCPC